MSDFAKLVLVADTTGLDKGTDSLDDLTKAGGRAEDAVGNVSDETKSAGDSADKMAGKMRMATKALVALGVASVGAVAAMGFRGAIREGELLERNMLRTTGIINATGAAAGRTAQQLHQQARELALGTLESTEGIMRAQQTMLSFRKIQGDVFDDAIEAALDLSSVIGADVNSTVIQLGKALEDPVKGLTALSRGGTIFTDSQKDMVKAMVKSGDIMDAQRFILEELALQYGGVAAAEAKGLAGAQDTLNQRQQEWLLKLNDTLGLTAAATAANHAMSAGVLFITDHMNEMIGIIAAATGAVLVGYSPAILAATVATGAWVASLFTLRGALIASGIGALIVGAGLLIGKFLELTSATGGWGGALSALGDLAAGVWNGIKTSAASIGPYLNSLWVGIQSAFTSLMMNLQRAWSGFIGMMADGVSYLPDFMQESMSGIQGAADRAGVSLINMGIRVEQLDNKAAALRGESARLAKSGFGEVKTALKDLILLMRLSDDAFEKYEDAADALETALAGLNDTLGDGSGGGTSGNLKKAKDEADKLADAFNGTLSSGIDGVSNAFGDFVTGSLETFGDFTKSITSQFKRMISSLISTAIANPIKIALGIGGVAGGAGSTAVAGGTGNDTLNSAAGILGGGGLGGIVGNLGSTTGLLGGAGNVINGLFGAGGTAGGFTGAISGLSGSLAGATGSLAGFAGAVGAIALPVLAIAGIFSFFKKKTKELDSGLRVTVDGMDALVETFSKIQTKRFWGLSKKVNTSYRVASGDVADPIGQIVGQLQGNVLAAAAVLGVGSSAFADFSHVMKVSTKGLSNADAQKAITEALQGLGDEFAGMVPDIEQYTRANEGASETLTRLSTSLNAVNDGADILGHTLFDVSLVGADAASRLVDAFGGVEAMTSAVGTYWAAFYTEAERSETTLRRLTEQFADIGVAMPQSRAQFRAMVEGIDATTEAGAALYAQLLNMSGALSEVLPQVAQFTMSMTGLLSQIGGEIGSMIEVATGLSANSKTAANLWYRTATTLRAFLSDLLNTNLAASSRSQTAAVNRNRYNMAYEMARGGDVDAARDIPGLAKAYLQSAHQTATTSLEYRQVAAKVQDQVNFLSGIAELEGANKDVLHSLYETQIDVLTNLGNFLKLEGLTDEQLSNLDDGIQSMITNWDGTVGAFEASLSALELAISEAEAFSYDDLVGKLDVFVSMAANGPAWLKTAIEHSADGILVALDFIVRSKLPAKDKWLAVNSLSEHIKTIDFVLGSDIDPQTRLIALAAGGELLRNLRFIVTEDIDDQTRSIALAGNSELTRTIRAVIAETSDVDAIHLALSNIGAYAVAVSASFAPGMSEDVQRLVLTQSGGYASMIWASMTQLSDEARRILLTQQGIYATNITAILQSGMNPNLKLMLLNYNTNGVRAVTLAMAFSQNLSIPHKNLLLKNGTTALRTINTTLNTFGLSSFDVLMLSQLNAGTGNINRGIAGHFWGSGISVWDSAFLDQLYADNGSVNRGIAGHFWGSGISAWDSEFIDQLKIGNGSINRGIAGHFWGAGISAWDAKFLHQLQIGDGEIQRIIQGSVNTGSLNASQLALLASITGSSKGTITLGGSFIFDPSTAFTGATNKLINPMNLLRSMLNELRMAVNADRIAREEALKKQAAIAKITGKAGPFTSNLESGQSNALDVVAQIEALEKSTGASLMLNGGDALLKINPDGTIAYDATSVKGTKSQIAAFGAQFWGAGGLQSLIGKSNQQINMANLSLSVLRKQVIALGGIPAFAQGGLHSGGLRLVGERGPELEYTGPSRIYSNAQTRNLFDISGLLAELRSLRKELASFKDQSRQLDMATVKNTRKSANAHRKWEKIGVPVRNPDDGTVLEVNDA